jgi:hypothetical protein
MKAAIITGLLVSSAFACGGSSDEGTDSANGAFTGAPGSAYDQEKADQRKAMELEAQKRAKDLKQAAYAAYRAETPAGVTAADLKLLACLGSLDGARAFDWYVPAPFGMNNHDAAMTEFNRDLLASGYANTVVIVQRPTEYPTKWNVSIYVNQRDLFCGADAAESVEVLRCSDVADSEGPSEQQCGIET